MVVGTEQIIFVRCVYASSPKSGTASELLFMSDRYQQTLVVLELAADDISFLVNVESGEVRGSCSKARRASLWCWWLSFPVSISHVSLRYAARCGRLTVSTLKTLKKTATMDCLKLLWWVLRLPVCTAVAH